MQGTPAFLARAVENDGPVPFPDTGVVVVAPVPKAPAACASRHPKRSQDFLPTDANFLLEKPHGNPPPWTHEVEHDSESVFWVFLYWVMGVQPADCPTEPSPSHTWSAFASSWSERNGLIMQPNYEGVVHSFLQPLRPLIVNLSRILWCDRYWLPTNDTRHHPGYIGEAFQRLILKFIQDNKGRDFMTRKMNTGERRPIVSMILPSIAVTRTEEGLASLQT